MRLPTALALGVATAAIATLAMAAAAIVPAAPAVAAPAVPGPAVPGPALADQTVAAGPGLPAGCGDPAGREFPLRAAIDGGPAIYRPGGEWKTWQLELTNTTRDVCREIHPVVVLTDRDRVLKASHVRMEFFDAEAGRHRPATLEETDEDETIGVLQDGTDFPGFTVEPGGTRTVEIRLAFTADAPPNEVVAEAAVVQRKGDDGDWVGESGDAAGSGDYRFSIAAADEGPSEPPAEGLASTGAGTGVDEDRLRRLAVVAGGLVLGGGALVMGARRLRRG
ncbi:hypothetical protein [Streptomyces sp. NPDC051219]|uniref:hypothetical protein n=1 Tax=Streptomyces sp. NPDC051219 TaxID=3155283 RepID=UPI00344555D8